jgi:hypothetical protein
VLGLPAIVSVQSDNQRPIGEALHRIGGHQLLGWARDLTPRDYGHAIEMLTPDALRRMSAVSAALCDGHGATRVSDQLLNWN